MQFTAEYESNINSEGLDIVGRGYGNTNEFEPMDKAKYYDVDYDFNNEVCHKLQSIRKARNNKTRSKFRS